MLQVNDVKKCQQQGMVRIPPDLFIENLVIEHIMYIWRQALLQTRNGYLHNL